MGEGSISIRVEKVFALLIESGFVYCCLWVGIKSAERVYTCREGAHYIDADFIPRFGVPCVPRAGLHGHGLGAIVCLGESGGRVSALDTEALACALGFVSDAHRDSRLRSEEPCRSLLDVLDRNAVRERVVD